MVLREHEAGAKTADLARKHGISEATLYNWKAKYGGMDVSDAKRLGALQAQGSAQVQPHRRDHGSVIVLNSSIDGRHPASSRDPVATASYDFGSSPA